MPMTSRASVSDGLKTILVCINSYSDLLMKGILYHHSFEGGKEFSNMMQFTRAVESILESTGFPRATTEKRRFNIFGVPVDDGEIVGKTTDSQLQKGMLATFKLKIIFRQNASWQGSLTWVETGVEESFRSELELFMLMDSAIPISNVV